MSNVKPYQEEVEKSFVTGNPTYVLGTRLREGEKLLVTAISGGFQNCATTEYVSLGYWNGHAFKEVYKAKPAVAGDLVHWTGEIHLREDQFLYAYCPDVANGEIMKLQANGVWE